MFRLNSSSFLKLIKKKYILYKISKANKVADPEDKGFRHWLLYYFWQQIIPKESPDLSEPLHIMLCFADHFEPSHNEVDLIQAGIRVKKWLEAYSQLADKYRDSDGKMPQHTWFYPPHHDHRFLRDLVDFCKKGYGEIEMHLHHNHMVPFPDTSETLRAKIGKCIEDYSKYGIFCLPDGSKTFAFVHGDWSLDNSRGEAFCGVNDEIKILKECGCYADFTFPSLGQAQPAMINKIYYAEDNPDRPKSYNWGKELVAGGKSYGDLLMIPGIVGLRWDSKKHSVRPSIEVSNVDEADIMSHERIDYLLKNAITIKGRPNWLFIKLHMHGMKNKDFYSLFEKSFEQMHCYLKEICNNNHRKKRYVLHYVTAREIYNIMKAAEADKDGNPNMYRDYKIPRYTYLSSKRECQI